MIKVVELYKQAGTALPGLVTSQLDEVRKFHLEVTKNRRRYLENEATRLQDELEKATGKQKELSLKKARMLRFLDTHGALEDYNELQKLSLDQRSALEALETQVE